MSDTNSLSTYDANSEATGRLAIQREVMWHAIHLKMTLRSFRDFVLGLTNWDLGIPSHPSHRGATPGYLGYLDVSKYFECLSKEELMRILVELRHRVQKSRSVQEVKPVKKNLLENVTDEELQAEIERRTLQQKSPPVPLENPDFSRLIHTVVEGVHNMVKNQCHDSNFDDLVCDEVMHAVYGDAYTKWRNKQDF